MSDLLAPKLEQMDIIPPQVADKKVPLSSPTKQDPSPPPSKCATPARNAKAGPLLIADLPAAREEALRVFEEIKDNHYQYGTLGRSKETLESMMCDCQYDHDIDEPHIACGEGSDCINRLTQVECLEEDCRCRSHCRNQRFQRKEYANIEIVLTEKKGYGLRAQSKIPKDDFIYEYVGDVVSQPSFAKRMREYAQEGIRHFYFMMLQKGEFIDATKRGGIGRFANHSCNPNCYVARWTVGSRVRMGIFAKRNIVKDEELTFNYNVDRYGHEAQPCYCGEPNCLGFIGGKTQTDVGAMDDLYLDALGISDEVEKFGLKGNKKKKGKKLDEDYIPDLKPLLEKDIPKVIQAVRQTQSRKVMVKLITRIKITEDQSALRQLMRLRGFSLLKNVLDDYDDDFEMKMLVMESVSTWPLIHRNKVEDSGIEGPIQRYTESDNEALRTIAGKLLGQWKDLEVAYRIPKRQKSENEPAVKISYEVEEEARPAKRNRMDEQQAAKLPKEFAHLVPLGTSGSNIRSISSSTSGPPALTSPVADRTMEPRRMQRTKQDIADIIAAAARAAEEAREAAAEAAAKLAAQAAEEPKKSSSKHKPGKKQLTKEEKEAAKEKKLLKLVGGVVVKSMSKYQKQMDHEIFKKHAKELTHTIAEKEKKSNTYKSGNLDSLSNEKIAKIKKFAKEYIAKVLRKLEKSGQKRHHSTSAGTSSVPETPRGPTDSHDETHDIEIDLNDTLGLDDDDIEMEDPSPATDIQGPEPDVSVVDGDDDDAGYVISSKVTRSSVAEFGWDKDKPVTASHYDNL